MDVREKLVGLLKEHFYDEYEFEAVADDLISQGVTVQEWISVKDERRPKHGDIVLCYMTFGEFEILQWDDINETWRVATTHYPFECVTHWQYLPQPPKGE